jgi:hypothetical protein
VLLIFIHQCDFAFETFILEVFALEVEFDLFFPLRLADIAFVETPAD